jgi:hypothetical protein
MMCFCQNDTMLIEVVIKNACLRFESIIANAYQVEKSIQ